MSTLKEKAESILAEKNAKIIPENLPENITAFGVQGEVHEVLSSYVESNIDMNATAYFDWGNGYRTLECRFYKDTLHRENSMISIPITNPDMQIDLVTSMGITPEKIKKDETILGVTGTLEGDFNEYGNYINYNTGFRDLCSKNLWPHTNISPNAETFGFIETIGGLSIQDTGANGVKLYGVFSIEKIIDSSNNPWVYILFLDNNNNVIGYASKQFGPTTQAWDKVVINQLNIYKLDRTRVTIEELLKLSSVRLTLTQPSA